MKTTTKTLLCQLSLMLVMTLMAVQPAHAQFGALKGLAKKAKENVSNLTGNAGDVGNVVSAATTATRETAPWPMSGGLYNGKDVREFLYGIAEVSDEEITALRDQNFARYKSNLEIQSGPISEATYAAQEENGNFMHLLYELRTIVSINVLNVQVSSNGAINGTDARYLITNSKGGGIGCYAMEKNGQFCFVTLKDDGTFLNAEEMAAANEAAIRMRKYQLLTYGLRDVLQADQANYDVNLGVMYNLCSMYATDLPLAPCMLR